MPYENEHAARIIDASKFTDVRRKNNELGDGIHAIYGITDDNGGEAHTELISVRFDKDKFAPDAARKWLKEHDLTAEQFEPAQAKKAGLVEIDLIITKANVGADGQPRWLVTASDTGADKTGEATSLTLFQNWINRIEKGVKVPFLPAPRLPFLGISHYPDLEGFGVAGVPEKMYIDGQQFKSAGLFFSDDAHPLGAVLYQVVQNERDFIRRGGAVDAPIRISAAWWDLQHAHGDFVFTRRNLNHLCPMCERGAGDKVYLDGQLDHYAATRVPINPRTTLALEEKSMAITRKDDAESIIGQDLAEELEKRAKLVGKSETEEAAVLVIKAEEPDSDDAPTVVKAESGKKKDKKMADDKDADDEEMPAKAKGKKANASGADDEELDDEESDGNDKPFGGKKAPPFKKKKSAIVEQMYDEEPAQYLPFGGAVTLADAMAVQESREKMHQVHDRWGVFMSVIGNIMEAESGEDETESDLVQRKLELMNQAVADLGDQISQLKAGLADAYLLSPVEIDDEEPDTEPVENTIIGRNITMAENTQNVWQDRVIAALQNPELKNRAEKAAAAQEVINEFAQVVRSELDKTAPPDVEALVNDAVQKSQAAILEQLAVINAKLAGPAQSGAQPQQKSLAFKGSAVTGPTPDQMSRPTSIRDIARRSVGL